MTQPRIAVLGGGGRVGRLLGHRLHAPRAAGLARVQSRRSGPGVDWVSGPEDDAELIDRLRAFAPDLVVALWGVTPQTGGDLSLNQTVALRAIDIAAAAGCPRVAVTSTSAVYGVPCEAGAMPESHPLQPVNDYGRSKVRMEQAVAEVCAHDAAGPSVVVLRLANVIGCDMLGAAVRQATTEQPVVLDRFGGDRGAIRSYLGPDTLWDTLLALASAALPREATFNLANGSAGVDMSAILNELQAAGAGVPWIWRSAPAHALREVILSTRALSATCPGFDLESRAGAKTLVHEWLGATGGAQ